MKKFSIFLIIILLGCFLNYGCNNQSARGSETGDVFISYDNTLPQASYAVRKLNKALADAGYTLLDEKSGKAYLIYIDTDSLKLPAEAYSLANTDSTIRITGGDARGMIYGCLSLAEDIRNGVNIDDVKTRSEKPHYLLRAIKHNTSWYSYRPSSALDQHYETLRDPEYWEAFLDMMAENRFNSLSIFNLHPFVFMITPKNFPEASPFSAEEMEEWKKLHKEIFRMAAERAIDVYLIPFNIFVSEEFSKAHNVALTNFYPHYYCKGDTSEIVKKYMRECVTQVLQEYPELTGFGLTLGEGMAGMTPQQREDWMFDTYIEGMRQAGRKSKLVHRIPFSSTTESLGATSVDLERLTRKGIEREASLDFIDGPIFADLKYNWSHAHSTPKLVKVHGGEMFDTFYNPEPDGYKITYTARNEDFFALRWGVPDFVRAHIAENSQSYAGGYFVGSETYIPALDYFTAVSDNIDWKFAFERQWLFYKIWGRLLYNPETKDDIFESEFKRRYGSDGENLLEAFSLASSTQLRLASLYDCGWDFTLYGEGFLALQGDSTKYISVKRLMSQPPLAPDYVSIKKYIDSISKGGTFSKEMITPPVLAEMLRNDCNKALKLVRNIDTRSSTALMYEVSDVKTWANLGFHLAEKLEGGMELERFYLTGNEDNRKKAIEHLEKALGYWDKVISITRPIYKDMPLAHYNGSSYDRNDNNLFHWARIRPEVANDVEIAKEAVYKE
ncbi:MAG TPA: glycoside hydrolase family 20 zincin-like fold domain-containing protein [Bacteroidales bacterium]|nr:glycoside hydrolase family 20 zincin-like fold domain-containing protein [Bacteroidales bacterium]